MYIGFREKHPLFLSDFKDNWNFSIYLGKTLKYQISWKSVQLEPSSSMRTDVRSDGPTDRHNEAPEKA